MNIRQASAWQEVVTGTVTGTVTVVGRASCQAGFTLIGTSGSTEAFCISSTMETPAAWLGAIKLVVLRIQKRVFVRQVSGQRPALTGLRAPII